MKKLTVTTETGTWEIKKPTARQIMRLSSVGDDLDDNQLMEIMGGLLKELVTSGPQEFMREGKLDVENLPAEDFFELFFASCGKAVKALQKFQG